MTWVRLHTHQDSLALWLFLLISFPWGLLLLAVFGLCVLAFRREDFISRGARGVLLSLNIGLGILCIELSVLRALDLGGVGIGFEKALVHLYLELHEVKEFFSITHTAIVLAGLFAFQALIHSSYVTGWFLTMKDALSKTLLALSVVYSFSCFSQEGLQVLANQNHDDMVFAYNLALRDRNDAAAEYAAATELRTEITSPSVVWDLTQRFSDANLEGVREPDKVVREVIRSVSDSDFAEMRQHGFEPNVPKRPTTKAGLSVQVYKMPEALTEPQSPQELRDQEDKLAALKAGAKEIRGERNSAVESLRALVIDGVGKLGAKITPVQSSVLSDIVEELVSNFADVFLDKAIRGEGSMKAELTVPNPVKKSASHVNESNAAEIYLWSINTHIDSGSIVLTVVQVKLVQDEVWMNDEYFKWSELEMESPRQLREMSDAGFRSKFGRTGEEGEMDPGVDNPGVE